MWRTKRHRAIATFSRSSSSPWLAWIRSRTLETNMKESTSVSTSWKSLFAGIRLSGVGVLEYGFAPLGDVDRDKLGNIVPEASEPSIQRRSFLYMKEGLDGSAFEKISKGDSMELAKETVFCPGLTGLRSSTCSGHSFYPVERET
jgi:hypothetical protein